VIAPTNLPHEFESVALRKPATRHIQER